MNRHAILTRIGRWEAAVEFLGLIGFNADPEIDKDGSDGLCILNPSTENSALVQKALVHR